MMALPGHYLSSGYKNAFGQRQLSAQEKEKTEIKSIIVSTSVYSHTHTHDGCFPNGGKKRIHTARYFVLRAVYW